MIYEVIESYKYKDLEKFTYAQLEGDSTDNGKMSINVYSPFEVDFTHNGLAILEQVEGGKIVEEINGEYYLEFTIRKDSRGKYKNIIDLCIIKAQNQLFRVPSMEFVKDTGFSIVVYCKHIWYDINEIYTEDRRVKEQLVDVALDRILEGDVNNRFIRGMCDVVTRANANFIDENADISIFDKIIPRWGGELYRDNYHFAIKNRLGKYKRDVQIRFGKNAKSLKKKIDYSEVCTRIFPFGKEGVDISGCNGGKRYLEADNIKSYPRLFPRRIKFEEIDTDVEVKKEAFKYLNLNKKPLVTITVDCIDLCYRKEYDQLKKAIALNLGDTITVIDDDLHLDEEMRVIKKEICPVTGLTLSLTLGDKTPNLAQKVTDNDVAISNTDDKIDEVGAIGSEVKENVNVMGEEVRTMDIKVGELGRKSETIGYVKFLTTVDKTDTVSAINEVNDKTGDLNNLPTLYKSNLVGAIKEVDEKIGNGSSDNQVKFDEILLKIGNLLDLGTVDKASLVGAVNEVLEKRIKYEVMTSLPLLESLKNGEGFIYDSKIYVKINDKFFTSALIEVV